MSLHSLPRYRSARPGNVCSYCSIGLRQNLWVNSASVTAWRSLGRSRRFFFDAKSTISICQYLSFPVPVVRRCGNCDLIKRSGNAKNILVSTHPSKRKLSFDPSNQRSHVSWYPNQYFRFPFPSYRLENVHTTRNAPAGSSK